MHKTFPRTRSDLTVGQRCRYSWPSNVGGPIAYKVLVLSDLHLEFAPFEPVPDLEFDVVILAGDIHSPVKRAVQWAVDRFRGKPVVYLLGNHEYYDGRLDTTLAEARRGS
ncbi:hypothetical protein QF040_005568 [Variovorax sp. W2I14]